MRWTLILGIGLVLLGAGCGSSSKSSANERELQHQADIMAIDKIEQTWHKAASTHNIDLMMSIWAPDATFNLGTAIYSGTAQIRSFWANEAGPFRPENHWVSDTPAYKVRITVSGDKGTLYFECHYVDVKTGKVKAVIGVDHNVQKIDGKWLIVSGAGSPATLGP